MILVLFLALFPAAPLTEDAGTKVRAVVARSDATHAAASLPLDRDAVGDARHVWIWTERLPPRRIDAASAVRSQAVLLEQLRTNDVRALTVRVTGWTRPEDLEDLRIIAAPTEMWRTVPEDLLPVQPVSREGTAVIFTRGPTRVRVVGKTLGSLWQDVTSERSVSMQVMPSMDAELRFESDGGVPVRAVFGTVMTARRGDAASVVQAQFAADDGVLRMRALPAGEIVSLVIVGEDAAPRTISGSVSELRRVVRLQRAAAIRGRFVDEKDRPLENVRVEAEGWMPGDAAALSRNDAVSDAAGFWTIGKLPRARVALRASHKGRVTIRKEVLLENGDVDLGTMVLEPSADIMVTVTDDAKVPLAGVTVTSDGGFRGKTNEKGTVVVTGAGASSPAELTFAADGFARRVVQLSPPLPASERVVLERLFTVSGIVVDDAGMPVRDASAVVTIDSRYRRTPVGEDGRFAIPLDSGRAFELTFESPSTASSSYKGEPGRAGESREIGPIRLPRGSIVRGRVTDDSGVPIAGARVWTLRPSAHGAIASWVAGRTYEGRTDAEGAFVVAGLSRGPQLLRIDAAGFARTHRDVLVDEAAHDAGTIELERGSEVIVKFGQGDATARIDLRREWLEHDMLTAPVVEGVARVRNVPAGTHLATVLLNNAVACQREIEVRAGAAAIVQCPPPMTVRGQVTLGGVPASGGSLVWSRPSVDTPGLIQTNRSALGAAHQRVFGIGAGSVPVTIAPDGTFETDRLQPGEWRVVWHASDGASVERTMLLPEAAEAAVLVEFSGAMIRGRAIDTEGNGVAGATIRTIDGPLLARSAPDGSFTLAGVPPGAHRLQATIGARASEVAEVVVEPGRHPAEVTLEVGVVARNVLTVEVLGADGSPRPNAFVFVDGDGGTKILTTDARGAATAAFATSIPALARIVAYSENAWAFGSVQRSQDGTPQSTTIRFSPTGGLRIRGKSQAGSPAIFSSAAGDLTWMLARVGYDLSVTRDAPALVHGLPAGTYAIRVGGATANASVTAGKVTDVLMP